jgi:phospholipid/cholesterol/gamma-HCH transport system substrate-binding protein
LETEARHVLVGAATVIFAGAILATIIWLAGLDVGGERERYLIFFEDNVSGLEEGGAVRINGVRVGSVASIRLQPARPDTVSVVVEARRGAPIAEGSVAKLQPRGITGAQFVTITAAEPDAPPLARRVDGLPVVPSELSMVSRMLERAPQILDNIGQATDRLSQLFGEGGDGTGALISSLTEAGDAAPATLRAVEAAARQVSDLARSGQTTLDAANRALARAEEALGAAEETLQGADGLVAEDLPALMEQARTAAAELADAAAAAERLVQRNDAPIARFANQGLTEIRYLVNEARMMVDQLTQVAEMLEDNPNAVIFGPAEGEFRPESVP